MIMKIKNVRVAFAPGLFEAQTVKSGEGKPAFSCTLILPPNHAQIKEITAEMKRVASEKWGKEAAKVYSSLEKTDKLAIHDGDAKPDYEGYPGNLFISARNQTRPTVKDRDGMTNLVKADGRPYSGCYIHAIIDIWAQDNQFGKRINASIPGAQFIRDGDSFGGGSRVASDDEFESEDETDNMSVDDDVPF